MQICHDPAPNARPFVTAPYWDFDEEHPRPPVLPSSCLNADGEPGGCIIKVHHLRERKTGPSFPIVVLRCLVHRHAFTLYPLGHMPYGRLAFAPVSCDGELLRSAEEPRAPGGSPCWQTTIFLAALNAASGQPWPRESDGITRVWETQLVDIEKSAKALGLCKETPPRIGEQIAQRLFVPRLLLLDAASAYQGASGYKERGGAIIAVLERLVPGRCLLDQLLACGVLSGLWGKVERWSPGRGGAHCAVFLGPGTPGA
jgi:hypothetical protein